MYCETSVSPNKQNKQKMYTCTSLWKHKAADFVRICFWRFTSQKKMVKYSAKFKFNVRNFIANKSIAFMWAMWYCIIYCDVIESTVMVSLQSLIWFLWAQKKCSSQGADAYTLFLVHFQHSFVRFSTIFYSAHKSSTCNAVLRYDKMLFAYLIIKASIPLVQWRIHLFW